jgi:hypothetical protein
MLSTAPKFGNKPIN